MKRKGLAIFLAVCLVFSMMTFAASAADDGGKVKRESISVEDTGASFRVVKGGRLEISSESAAEDGSYSWDAVKNDGIVKVVASEGKKPLILEAQQVGKATFKLVAGEDEVQFDVVVITDQKGVVIDPEEVEVTVGDTVPLKAVPPLPRWIRIPAKSPASRRGPHRSPHRLLLMAKTTWISAPSRW